MKQLPGGFVRGSWCVPAPSNDDRAFVSLIVRRHAPDPAPVVCLNEETFIRMSILNHLEPRREEQILVRRGRLELKAWAAGDPDARDRFARLVRGSSLLWARIVHALRVTPECSPFDAFVDQLRQLERRLPKNKATLEFTSEEAAVLKPMPTGRDQVVAPLVAQLLAIGRSRTEVIQILSRAARIDERTAHRWAYRRLFPPCIER